MKNFKQLLFLLIAISVFTGCQEKDSYDRENVDSITKKSLDYDNAFNNTIGFTDVETSEFVEINETDLINHWRDVLDINDSTSFNIIELVEVNDDESSYHMLYARSEDGKTNITSKALLTDFGIELTGETCKCKSTGCSFGCEVMSMCKCSNCSRNGTCTKTHTLSELTRASFQLVD